MSRRKVSEVTLYFWIIKILGTRVGETAADSLNADLGIVLTGTAALTTGLLVIALGSSSRGNSMCRGSIGWKWC
ncbi:hypothetical protein [Rhodococcus sp. IEGM 1379]|uniref:hypothetical protein n=1 Tax=Rhodococcus sp. IEGM 1379 TaxID=3047086 RepID=UPI0024B7BDDA|nr:hypothetical protein [Rhodococcus sp. IEGM 1379]MDI9916042.1 hypothetical protein [Rhodococcus sp. IEGM 1379]